jgi:hypothetical protein
MQTYLDDERAIYFIIKKELVQNIGQRAKCKQWGVDIWPEVEKHGNLQTMFVQIFSNLCKFFILPTISFVKAIKRHV